MKLATTLCLACGASWILAGPTAGSESVRHGCVQVLAVDVSLLRHEFYDVGWQRSFYVSLGDTYASFVTGQLNRLCEGEYIDLMPQLRAQADALDSEARFRSGSDKHGGWVPVGWSDGDLCHDLLILTRRAD